MRGPDRAERKRREPELQKCSDEPLFDKQPCLGCDQVFWPLFFEQEYHSKRCAALDGEPFTAHQIYRWLGQLATFASDVRRRGTEYEYNWADFDDDDDE